jgi:hypothetical protein
MSRTPRLNRILLWRKEVAECDEPLGYPRFLVQHRASLDKRLE